MGYSLKDGWAKTAFFAVVPALLLLSGCGGGDDSGGGSTVTYTGSEEEVAIADSTTAKSVALAAVGFDADFAPTEMSGFMPMKASSGGEESYSLEQLSRFVLELGRRLDREESVLAGVTQSESCGGGGSISGTSNFASETSYTVGDSASFSADNCTETSTDYYGNTYTFQINGSITMAVTEVQGDPLAQSGAWALGLRTNYNGLSFSMEGSSISVSLEIGGGYDGRMAGSDYTVTSSSMEGTEFILKESDDTTTSEFKLTNFSMSASYDDSAWELTQDSDYTVATTELGGSVTVDTTTPFVCAAYGISSCSAYSGSYTQGVMVISAGDAKVKVAVETEGYVEVYEDLDGDGDWETHNQYSTSEF